MTTALTEQDYTLLSAYIDGELAPTECRKLEDRIANCPVLTRQFNVMAGQSVMLRNQSERLLNDAIYPELSQNIADILDQKPISGHVHSTDRKDQSAAIRKAANSNSAIWTGIGAAAAVLIAFVGGNVFNQNMTTDNIGAFTTPNAQSASYSPVNNPVLDMEISQTLEKTLSGSIRNVALDPDHRANEEIQIEPLRTFRQAGRFCREYRVTFPVNPVNGDGLDEFYGRACRTDEGIWETVYRLIPGVELRDADTPDSPKQKL